MTLWCRGALALCCALLCPGAHAQTIEDLQRELAAKDTRIKQLEQQLARSERKRYSANAKSVTGRPISSDLKRAKPSSLTTVMTSPVEDDVDRALERTMVREGALVLPPWTYELTPQYFAGGGNGRD